MSYFRIAVLLAAALYALIAHAVEAFDALPNADAGVVIGRDNPGEAHRDFRQHFRGLPQAADIDF